MARSVQVPRYISIDLVRPFYSLPLGHTISFEDIKASVQKSLDEIKFIPDLLLIHNPHIPEKGKIGDFWKHLETLVQDGTLKGCSLGISNFRPVDIEELMKSATIKPVVNREWQLRLRPGDYSETKP